jgi:4-carboxymuconolactone decarboxylase
VLFGEVWERPQLAPRDRSLVTVSALITMNLAFYTGWPNAVTAVGVARDVFHAETQRDIGTQMK